MYFPIGVAIAEWFGAGFGRTPSMCCLGLGTSYRKFCSFTRNLKPVLSHETWPYFKFCIFFQKVPQQVPVPEGKVEQGELAQTNSVLKWGWVRLGFILLYRSIHCHYIWICRHTAFVLHEGGHGEGLDLHGHLSIPYWSCAFADLSICKRLIDRIRMEENDIFCPVTRGCS